MSAIISAVGRLHREAMEGSGATAPISSGREQQPAAGSPAEDLAVESQEAHTEGDAAGVGLANFNPDEPRDRYGRWTKRGAGAASSAATRAKATLAQAPQPKDAKEGSSDATSSATPARGQRETIEDEKTREFRNWFFSLGFEQRDLLRFLSADDQLRLFETIWNRRKAEETRPGSGGRFDAFIAKLWKKAQDARANDDALSQARKRDLEEIEKGPNYKEMKGFLDWMVEKHYYTAGAGRAMPAPNKVPTDLTTPAEYCWTWLRGNSYSSLSDAVSGYEYPPTPGSPNEYRGKRFYIGDVPYTMELRESEPFAKFRAEAAAKVVAALRSGGTPKEPLTGDANYKLGLADVATLRPLADIATMGTGGKLGGNVAAAFVGSFEGRYLVDQIDPKAGTARITFEIYNCAHCESATRIPLPGGKSTSVISDRDTGSGQTVDQYFRWSEPLNYRALSRGK
jgi:hypothetical protein